ncbi:MAG TPA: DUF6600 domain-containing protein [Tepidisphaeraceae bacterium]|jgi:hypothetical protein|nr:DUF6600 domain-containing protein [Tepidisphaeraceae bacterium]
MRLLTLSSLCFIILAGSGCDRQPNDGSAVQATKVADDSAFPSGPGDALPPPSLVDDSASTTEPATAPATMTAVTIPATAATDIPAYDTEQEAAYFDQYLSPLGEWIQVDEYGPCWRPYNSPPDWRPYTVGHWIYTVDGWFWASDEPFGWCCYHYGRWTLHPRHGWCWVPGRLWGPGWVLWRHGDGVIGWAPLPPARPNVIITREIAQLHPFCFSFIDEKHFLDDHVGTHCEPITRNITLLSISRNITRHERVGGRFVNRGVDVREVERVVGRPIRPLTIREAQDPRSVRIMGENEVATFRPRLPQARPPIQQPNAGNRPAPSQQPPRFFSPDQPRNLSLAELEARRRQSDAYYGRLQAEMQQRHQREMQRPAQPQPQPNRTQQQMQAQQQREQRSFEEMRQRSQNAQQDHPTVLRRRQ